MACLTDQFSGKMNMRIIYSFVSNLLRKLIDRILVHFRNILSFHPHAVFTEFSKKIQKLFSRAKVPLVSAYQIILCFQAQNLFNLWYQSPS